MRKKKNKAETISTAIYLSVLALFSAYVLLDAFVIEERYSVVAATAQYGDTVLYEKREQAEWTDTGYIADGLSVALATYRVYDSDIYVADIVMDDISRLKAAFAEDTYGRNVTELTSAVAERQNAVLAINGDFYGAQRRGYVVRNGVLYRDSASGDDSQVLCVWRDGSFSVIDERETTAQSLIDDGAWQVLSFGPALVVDGEVAVSEGQEVGKAASSNPRTAIAVIEPLHYLFVVADGRTDESAGVSLYELADFLKGLGAEIAYNLDGGGSSTMVFGGEIINFPTSWGGKFSEREVSDIVYVQ